MTTDKYPDLVRKLKEIFQIDKPELDFGVYRVLNARRREIENFLDNRLKARVEAALGASASAERDAVAAELRKAEEGARALGVDPASVPKVKELGDRLAALSGAATDAESVVYANLLAFFSRYYEGGDFISQRRYKDGVYAIPYSGEEVKLHWANADQYYTKTGEAFTNYDFPLDGGLRVRFRLVSANTAKDNAKDNDAVRRFKLWVPADTPAFDPDDEEEAERIKAQYPADFIEERDGELWIYFQYLKFPKSQKQKELLDTAEEEIKGKLSGAAEWTRWAALFGKASKDDKRSLLRKHLESYAAKNSSDYFIHKDLGAFLRRELDFYVKNEMMRLDEVEAADFDRDLAPRLRTIRAFRAVAKDLIDFMAQLEDFQKKLWLKKKFVVQCDWCMTLDLVPEELRAEVLANEKQRAVWDDRGFGDSDSLYRMVDTRFFPESFKAKLLASIDNLDERTDGVLIRSENFQALRLMQELYKDQIKCIYIDPPYNTGNDGFLYKDGYSHSSWLSMMEERLSEAKIVLPNNGVIFISIDDNELSQLCKLCDKVFGETNFLGLLPRRTKSGGGSAADTFAIEHDYVLAYAKNAASLEALFIPFDPKYIKRYAESDEKGRYFWDTMERSSTKTKPYKITAPDGTLLEGKWFRSEETFKEDLKTGEVRFLKKKDGSWSVQFKQRMAEGRKLRSILGDDEFKSLDTDLQKLGLGGIFAYPKPVYLLKHILQVTKPTSIILDFFAGSGTTGHSVIDLNRQDREKGIDAKRKYILVEMGEHFDTVLKPRIEKVVYSPDWKDGKPQNTDKGISHCFNYLTLESYEDTLNNLELKKPEGAAPDLLGEDEYLLRYMLDVEARGSLLSTDDFRHPFDYGMKIAADSSGAWTRRRIDLVETFNWLVGLRVEHEERHIDRQGVVLVEGTLPSGETALVVWRDCDKADNAALAEILKAQGYLSKADEKPLKDVGTIFVNGDHALPPVLSGETGETKVRQIEEVFLSKMWEEC